MPLGCLVAYRRLSSVYCDTINTEGAGTYMSDPSKLTDLTDLAGFSFLHQGKCSHQNALALSSYDLLKQSEDANRSAVLVKEMVYNQTLVLKAENEDGSRTDGFTNLESYPDAALRTDRTTGKALVIGGKIEVKAEPTDTVNGRSNRLVITGQIEGFESDTSVSLHIHTGTSCADHNTVGEHWFNQTLDLDPWTALEFTTRTDIHGEALIAGIVMDQAGLGYPPAEFMGHVVVVHDYNGTKVGCGVLSQFNYTTKIEELKHALDAANDAVETATARCAFFGRNVHSRKPLDPTHVRLKRTRV
jgi:hypothetical protein